MVDKPADNVIEVRNLVTHYGDQAILRGIDLCVRRGEILVIIGASGSGKSTLLRYLLGLESPTSGRITLLGRDLADITPSGLDALRRNIGVAFQDGALIRSLTVGENLRLPLREHTHLPERIMRIVVRMKLEAVALGDTEHLMPAQLSGGMTKRAALARAVVMDPELLFFDEPSAGLDPVASAELDEMILELRAAMGMSMVIVTHELESAFKLADRITVLDEGRLLTTGTVAEIRSSVDRRVQDLLQRRPRADAIDGQAYLERLTRV